LDILHLAEEDNILVTLAH